MRQGHVRSRLRGAGAAVATIIGATTLGASSASATTYTFTQIDAPFANVGISVGSTFATGINNAGQVVGYVADGAGNDRGFVFNAQTSTYAPPIDASLPGVIPGTTQARGIDNAGNIVGSVNLLQDGFIDQGGTFTQLDAPFANIGNSVGTSQAFGINNAGTKAVGFVTDPSGNNHGFVYDTIAKSFAQLDANLPGLIPGTTEAFGINNAGNTVGGINAGSDGFADIGGVFTQLDAPFANIGNSVGITQAFGINDLNEVVGWVDDPAGNFHGFLYDAGLFTEIDAPAGFPGTTQLFGINDEGQIVGTFSDDLGTHGFLLTPVVPTPEPASLLLLGAGLLGLRTARRRA